MEGDGRGGGVVEGQIGRTGTGGDVVEHDVVEVGVPSRGACVGADADIAAGAGVAVEGHFVVVPGYAQGVGNGGNGHEGAKRVGVGKDADGVLGSVGGRR